MYVGQQLRLDGFGMLRETEGRQPGRRAWDCIVKGFECLLKNIELYTSKRESKKI